MSSFVKSKSFKYAKNLIIGVGAAVVLMGALFKLQSWPYASEMLIIGLSVVPFDVVQRKLKWRRNF